MKQEPVKTSPDAQDSPERLFLSETALDHDLFKLEVANAVKNVSFSDIPNLVKVEHVHFYHTIDSNGVKLDAATSIAGHCHEMILVKAATEKSPAVYKSGPAVVSTFKRVQGRMVKTYVKVPHDDHSHDVVYLKSDKVTPRKPSANFARVQHQLEPWENKPSAVAGIIERG